uniref:PDZ domain-containing protein n=1 Tax=Rhizochromulina marina TaxID=1034831 RepID=A0A7S2RLL6_9STRA|mmetsp:Transcript_17918/g.52370  ORF Transcript_17918/g.52370 Transcript_17918/m.52370 type:complete len:473 (+) Transcript_17918:50-1468(+)
MEKQGTSGRTQVTVAIDLSKPFGCTFQSSMAIDQVTPQGQVQRLGLNSGHRLVALANSRVRSVSELDRLRQHLCTSATATAATGSSLALAVFEAVPATPDPPRQKPSLAPRAASASGASKHRARPSSVSQPEREKVHNLRRRTAQCVRGSQQWLEKHARFRREDRMPQRWVEVLMPRAARVGGDNAGPPVAENESWSVSLDWSDEEEDYRADGSRANAPDIGRGAASETPPDMEWVLAKLAQERPGGRQYILQDGTDVYILTQEGEHCPIRSRVRPVGAAPRARVRCFLCNEQAGIHSIKFHFQRCLEKWDRRLPLPVQAALEMCDPRCLPTKPGRVLDEYNARAEWLHYNTVMPQCPNCGVPCSVRALIPHARNCCKDCPLVLEELERRFEKEEFTPLGREMMAVREHAFKQSARREMNGGTTTRTANPVPGGKHRKYGRRPIATGTSTRVTGGGSATPAMMKERRGPWRG